MGIVWLIVATTVSAATSGGLDFSFKGRGSTAAVASLLARTLRQDLATLPFTLQLVQACKGTRPTASESELCFELEDGPAGTVLIRGTSGPDLARGAAVYLRERCNFSFAWPRAGGIQRPHGGHVGAGWPPVGSSGGTRWRLRDIAYGFNVVTFSYSHAWLPFERGDTAGSWEEVIDWMALSGCNLALAYTGQEEVYRKVYAALGVSSTEFAAWSNGPAHLAWSRGQSMHGVGGPLPLSFARSQWDLQRDILARMRALGVVPVLPAFQGNVPPVLADLFPAANITVQKAHWGGGRAAWLDATDPLYQRIGDLLMAALIKDFGIDADGDGVGDETEHWYAADGYFAAGDPPWRRRALAEERPQRQRPSPLTASPRPHGYADDHDAFVHAARAYAAMNATDPLAIWLYQGWILDNTPHDLAVVRAYVDATPRGRLLISDMWAEWRPIISTLAAAGCPYLYGVLQNFGGTLYLGMSTEVLNSGSPEDPAAAPSVLTQFGSHAGGAGIGAFPEGVKMSGVRTRCRHYHARCQRGAELAEGWPFPSRRRSTRTRPTSPSSSTRSGPTRPLT